MAEALEKVKDSLDIKDQGPEEGKGPGRPAGSYGQLKAIKKMTSREKDAELGRNRKKVQELEARLNDLMKKAEAGAVEVIWLTPVLLSVYVNVHSGLAKKYGPHWNVPEVEAKDLHVKLNKVLLKYQDKLKTEHEDLYALGLTILMYDGQRIIQTKALMEKKGKERKADDKES